MGRRKRREDAPLSLFSFQDIMACLTGILILVALLLAIDGLSDEMQATPGKSGTPEEAKAPESADELRERIAILTRTLEQRKGGRDVTQGEVDILDDRIRQMAQDSERAKRRVEEAAAERARVLAEQEAAARKVDELKQRVAAARKAAQADALRERVKFRPGMKYPKSPVFVEPMAGKIVVGELDAARVPVHVATLADPDADARLVGALGPRMPDKSYMVFVVHEDAIPRFEALRDRMIRRGYEVGWQLWDGASGGFLDGAADSTGQVPLDVPAAAPPAAPPAAPAKGAAP